MTSVSAERGARDCIAPAERRSRGSNPGFARRAIASAGLRIGASRGMGRGAGASRTIPFALEPAGLELVLRRRGVSPGRPDRRRGWRSHPCLRAITPPELSAWSLLVQLSSTRRPRQPQRWTTPLGSGDAAAGWSRCQEGIAWRTRNNPPTKPKQPRTHRLRRSVRIICEPRREHARPGHGPRGVPVWIIRESKIMGPSAF